MGYIQDSLGANETVHYVAHFPWIRYALAYGALALSAILAVFSYDASYPLLVLGPVVVGLAIFLTIMFPIWTAEIGVTNQRVIYKRGFIQRETQEIQLRSIEEVALDQDLLGRILGYGKLEIHGTGDDEIVLPAIGDPLAMRRALQEAVGSVQANAAPVARTESTQGA